MRYRNKPNKNNKPIIIGIVVKKIHTPLYQSGPFAFPIFPPQKTRTPTKQYRRSGLVSMAMSNFSITYKVSPTNARCTDVGSNLGQLA